MKTLKAIKATAAAWQDDEPTSYLLEIYLDNKYLGAFRTANIFPGSMRRRLAVMIGDVWENDVEYVIMSELCGTVYFGKSGDTFKHWLHIQVQQ